MQEFSQNLRWNFGKIEHREAANPDKLRHKQSISSLTLVELIFDWDFNWKDVRLLPHVPKKPRQSRLIYICVWQAAISCLRQQVLTSETVRPNTEASERLQMGSIS